MGGRKEGIRGAVGVGESVEQVVCLDVCVDECVEECVDE